MTPPRVAAPRESAGPITGSPERIARKPAGGYQYRVGSIPNASGWTYVAFLDQKKANLRYFRSFTSSKGVKGHVEVGTIGWATNNPGNADYRWPGAKNSGAAAVSAFKDDGTPDPAVYEKDPADTSYKRFAIFHSAAEGKAAILPMLQRFVGEKSTASVEEALARFKGKEPDDSDLRLMGKTNAEIAAMSDPEKRKAVRDNYIQSVRGFLRSALLAQDPKMSQATLDARIDKLLKTPVNNLAGGDADTELLNQGLMRKEGSTNPAGIEYRCSKEIRVLEPFKLDKGQHDAMVDLVQNHLQDVITEMEAVLGCKESPRE